MLSADEGEALIISGCVSNQVAFRPLFDHVILLSAPVDLIISRTGTRAANDFGKHPEQLARVLRHLRTLMPLLRRSATLEVDTTAPLEQVFATILAHIR